MWLLYLPSDIWISRSVRLIACAVETTGGSHFPVREMRSAPSPFVFSNMKSGQGLDEIIQFVVDRGMLKPKELNLSI